jgi:hypothetical protein
MSADRIGLEADEAGLGRWNGEFEHHRQRRPLKAHPGMAPARHTVDVRHQLAL